MKKLEQPEAAATAKPGANPSDPAAAAARPQLTWVAPAHTAAPVAASGPWQASWGPWACLPARPHPAPPPSAWHPRRCEVVAACWRLSALPRLTEAAVREPTLPWTGRSPHGPPRGCWPPLFRVPGLPGLPPARSKASSRHQHQRSAAWGATDLPTALPLACSAVRSGRCCRSGEGRPGGLEVGLHAAPAVEHWKADQFACRSSGEARSIRAAAMAGTAAASGERRQAAAAVGGHASRAASSALTSTYGSLRLLIEHPR